MMGRLFDPRVGYFTEEFTDYSPPQAVGREQGVHHPLPARKEGPQGRRQRARQADRVLPVEGNPREVAAVPEEGRRGLEAGVREGGLQERDHLQGRPQPQRRPELGSGRCPLHRSSAGSPSRSPTRWGRTSTIRAPARSSPRTSSSGTTSSSSPRCGTSCSARPSDPKARKLPLPDELTGELLRYICCHEVGHTLGLRHNHRASQAYSISQLRDPEFCKKHGSVASIMSYGRFNYVCQPEDKRASA